MKSQTVAIFCALFGGGLGLQYIYLRRPVDFILCHLFCWTFIPMVWGILHGCIFMGMSDEKWINYNQKEHYFFI